MTTKTSPLEAVSFKRKVAQIYLSIVPLLVTGFGFGLGSISYKVYLPVWLFNVVLMIVAAWTIGLRATVNENAEKKQLAAGAFCLIIPWILISMFFGLGPPPDSVARWAATASEQQTRYSMLIIAGISIATGFALIKEKLKNTAGNFYSTFGITAILIAIPLFILNMAWWGSYLTDLYKTMSANLTTKKPEWFFPLAKEFDLINMVELALTYISITAFALAFRRAGWFSAICTRIYVGLSILGLVLITIPSNNSILDTASYFVSIPAIPFLMPYFMGINLLKRAGRS